jgi:hypothetical protein
MRCKNYTELYASNETGNPHRGNWHDMVEVKVKYLPPTRYNGTEDTNRFLREHVLGDSLYALNNLYLLWLIFALI